MFYFLFLFFLFYFWWTSIICPGCPPVLGRGCRPPSTCIGVWPSVPGRPTQGRNMRIACDPRAPHPEDPAPFTTAQLTDLLLALELYTPKSQSPSRSPSSPSSPSSTVGAEVETRPPQDAQVKSSQVGRRSDDTLSPMPTSEKWRSKNGPGGRLCGVAGAAATSRAELAGHIPVRPSRDPGPFMIPTICTPPPLPVPPAPGPQGAAAGRAEGGIVGWS